jgi:hypothetical protein
MIDCATGHRQCGTYGAGFWTHRWGQAVNLRHVPDAWNRQKPVAFGPELVGLRSDEGEDGIGYFGTYDTDSLDPQVTLRYRPNDDTSIYAKWVRAFKSGGFDTASRSIPDSTDKFTYDNEDSEAFEVGIKGSLLDSRIRYGASVFRHRTYGLQLETVDPTGGSDITQAGQQETKGLEFDAMWAVSDRMTASLTGALMDGTLIEFPNAGCTEVEFLNADVTDCISAEESEELVGDDSLEGVIDRSGYPSPRTPDWKFAVEVDYWHPVSDNLKATFNTNAAFSDGFIHDVEGYSQITAWGKHVDWNITTGIASRDDSWRISLFARNILNARNKYFPEFDVFPVGIQSQGKSNTSTASQYFTYGVQLGYNYN